MLCTNTLCIRQFGSNIYVKRNDISMVHYNCTEGIIHHLDRQKKFDQEGENHCLK